MLLNDIGKSPTSTFKRINQHLESNYGFKISEDVSDKDLVMIIERIEDEITELKIKGDDAKASPEISKRLLVLEGVRQLRESVLTQMQMQTPGYDKALQGLTNFVLELYTITATKASAAMAFENAIARAMDEYRSSKYRFPDDEVEANVRNNAADLINRSDSLPEISIGIGEDAWRRENPRGRSSGGYIPEPEIEFDAPNLSLLDKPEVEPEDDEIVPMVRNNAGQMVPDPFAAQKIQRRKGIVMKEQQNLVKNLRKLLETEVSQAEVMMAAKGFASELQEMIEKIGRLQNEDLPPVTDQMRETYGMESASAFQTQIYGALQSVMDSLYTAKAQVDDSVSNMATTGQFGAETDMDADLGTEPMADPTAMDADLGDEADLDNIGDELGAEMDDEFGGAEAEEPLGRSMKAESVRRMEQKIVEMQKLVAKVRKLKESKQKRK